MHPRCVSDRQGRARSQVLGGPGCSPRAHWFTTRTRRTQRRPFTPLPILARHKGTDRLKSAAGGCAGAAGRPGPELTSLPACCLPTLTCDDRHSPALQSLGNEASGGPALPRGDFASSPRVVRLNPPGQRPPSKQRFEIRTFQGPRGPLPGAEVRGHVAPGAEDPSLHTCKGAIPTRLETHDHFKSYSGTSLTSPLCFPVLEAERSDTGTPRDQERQVLSRDNRGSVGPGGGSGAMEAPGVASLGHGDKRTAVTATWGCGSHEVPAPSPLGSCHLLAGADAGPSGTPSGPQGGLCGERKKQVPTPATYLPAAGPCSQLL